MKTTLLVIFTFSIAFNNFGQTNLTYVEKLESTAKIWGFLKYYHPEIGKGKFNWDNELLEILPKIDEAKNKQELSNTYMEWIESLGEIKKCKKCKQTENKDFFGKNFDLSWTRDDSQFSEELIEKLSFIEKNRFSGDHHYFSSFKDIGNVKIQNELEYANFSWKNKNLRMLSLFRYWNYIEYFFPYKYLMDKDWDVILYESILNFLNPKSETDYHLAMLELIVNINDSHGYFNSNLIDDYFGQYWFPVQFQIIDNKAIVSDYFNIGLAKKNDLQIGDAVLKVDGEEIASMLLKNDKYINASNSSVKKRNARKKIFNGQNSSVTITYERNEAINTKTIQRYPFQQFKYENPIESKWKILDNNIGYINMGTLERVDVNMVMDSLSKTKAIIFDIRNYPNNTLYLISGFLNKSSKEFVKFIIPDLKYPGKFNWTKTISAGHKNINAYSGKVIILVNEITQSHAEFTTMCLQTADNVIVVGSQTSGADGNVSKLKFVGGFETWFTAIGVFYPNGKETQRIGIIPNIEVKPTQGGIKNGLDEVLERAILEASN
jgi:C-terminal processing protease CtpA/Prc